MKKFLSLLAVVTFTASMMAADVLSVNFKADGQGDWTIDNKVMPEGVTYVWKYDANYGMKATAYVSGTRYATESWLVSPVIDLSGVTEALLSFKQALNYASSGMSVKVTEDGANWSDLEVSPWPAGNNWTFVDSKADLTAYAGKATVQIALVYTSTETTAGTWEIESLAVTDGGEPTPPVGGADAEFTSADFNGQGTSGSGGNVTATKNGVTFTCNKAYGDQYGVRCYKNGVVTISSAEEQIGKIVFEFATVSGTTYNGDLPNEIIVNGMEWTNTMTNQARMNKISVYFGEYEAPTIDTLNAAEAIEKAGALADNQTSTDKYYIEAYAVNVEPMSAQYKDQNFYLVDNAEEPNTTLQVYRAAPTKDGQPYPVLAGDKLRLFGQLKKYVKEGADPQLEVVNATVEFLEEVEGDRTIEDPAPVQYDTISVARALEIGGALTAGQVSDKMYVIGGYVSSIISYFDTQYGNETFWMVDEKGGRAASNEAGAFEVYRGKPTPAAEIGLDAKVFVTAKIKNYNGIIETDGTPAVNVVEAGHEEVIEAITVAQAVEIGLALADKQVSDNRYEITGYVSSIVENYNEQYGNETFWITDEKGKCAASSAAGAFEVYRGKPNTKAEIGYDAKIKIVCKIKNYSGTIENDGSNIEFEVLEQGTARSTDTITVARALEIGAALEDNEATCMEYVIAGYVSSIENYFDPNYKNETFWIADEKGSLAASNEDGAFYVYRGKPDSTREMGWGAKVYVTTKIKKYAKACATPVIENDGANVPVAVIEFGEEEEIIPVTVAQALEIGLALGNKQATPNRYEITGFVSSIDEPFSDYGNETLWISDDSLSTAGSTAAGAFEIYRGKPDSEAEVGMHAKVKIICKIKNYNGTIENDGMNIAFNVLSKGEELVLDTVSVERAIEIGMALEDGGYADRLYVIKGYAVKAYAPDSCSTSQTWFMADEPDVKGNFEAYKCSPDMLVEDNDYVLLLGKIQKYVSAKGVTTIEVGYGRAVHAEAPKLDTITVAEAMEIGNALADNTMTEDRYAVLGYVASIEIEFAEDIQSFSLSDNIESATGEFKALNAFIAEPGAVLHDKVLIVGRIQKRTGATATLILMEGGKAQVIPGEGIEQVVVTETTAQKILIDGVIYIVRDNKIFNLQGAQVR